MSRGFGMITALLVLTAAFSVGGTVMSKERTDYTRENERYALMEDTFCERAREILEEQGFHDSGVTLTWTRENGGVRSYRVEIHHSRIDSLEREEKESLTRRLYCEDFCKEAAHLVIVYT